MAGEARSAYPLRIIYVSERLGLEGFNRCRLDMRGRLGTRLGGLSCMWMEAEKKGLGRARINESNHDFQGHGLVGE